MSILERTIQSVIFELGAILIGMLVIEFIPHEGQPLLLMILISLTAVIWNFIFNWIFDKLVPGDRLARGPVIRTIHAVLFGGYGANDYVHDEYQLMDGVYYGYFNDLDYLGIHICL